MEVVFPVPEARLLTAALVSKEHAATLTLSASGL
jgi:hypothetical protein